jgi:alpha-ribazole phosphatase
MKRVVRHGAVAADGICYGQLDLVTVEPAQVCAQALLSEPASEVWSSPLRRCAETAKCLADAWGVALHLDPRLMELSFGEWEGNRWAELEQSDASRLQVWMANWQEMAPPGGETLAQLEHRVKEVWAEIPDDALVVTHAGVIRCLKVFAGSEWATAMQQKVPHLQPLPLP